MCKFSEGAAGLRQIFWTDSGKYEQNMRLEVVITLDIRIMVLWDVTAWFGRCAPQL
jgi:hypothetical protein